MHLTNLLRAQANGLPLSEEERVELSRYERLSEAERRAELRAWAAVAVAGGLVPDDRPSRAA